MWQMWLCAGLVTFALASCAKSPGDEQRIEITDDREQVEALPPGQLDAMFARAIRDAGLECQWVEHSEQGADVAGRPTWQARCMEGRDFSLVLQKDGIIQVVPPKALPRSTP